ncbi:class I SAM-dependent methyltransferase [Ktedonobacter racemifer]|uniref:Methyltransferase type 11 n=1 Tax=Ktedonobacter racemifer DSM 44963 TaxID=485913 RepID=D6TTQ5_KTERA|nr:class I SAM-dependent methyltransferase [Ktedonobacter racemifer]EFH83806.1 Methyltransferase type 11 [Ktedonobacter racemifer DSM 44963]
MFDFDAELAERYGAFTSYTSSVSPALVEYYGENPAAEVDRLLDQYAMPESNVLDLGCGAGQTLCRLAPKVKHIWGLDQNKEMLEVTGLRAERLGLKNVTTVHGSIYDAEAIASLPDDTFGLVFSRRGPNFNEQFIPKLRQDAMVVQEFVSGFDGYPLGEIFGRRHYTPYYYTDHELIISTYAGLGLFPVSSKVYFYEEYFRDGENFEAYLKQMWAMLGNWRLPPCPYEAARDRAALDLYVRYNTTPKGVRLLRQRKVYVLRRAPVAFYPCQ